jgi:HK97 gp10 family phage protein
MADEDIFDIDVSAAQVPVIRQFVENAMSDILNYAEAQAKANVNRRTGNLGRNIGRTPVRRVGNLYWGQTGAGKVGVGKTAPYAKWVEAGTGIFGVFKHPIVPTTGNFLRWKVFDPNLAPRDRPYFYARSVKGQRPQRFMRRAYNETRTIYVPYRIQLLKAEIAAAVRSANP